MKKSSRNRQGPANTVCASNRQEMSTRISDFFYSVTADMTPLDPRGTYHASVDCTVPARYTISVQQVQKQLESINTRKARGPDGIPNWVLKEYAEVLSAPLCVVVLAMGLCRTCGKLQMSARYPRSLHHSSSRNISDPYPSRPSSPSGWRGSSRTGS